MPFASFLFFYLFHDFRFFSPSIRWFTPSHSTHRLILPLFVSHIETLQTFQNKRLYVKRTSEREKIKKKKQHRHKRRHTHTNSPSFHQKYRDKTNRYCSSSAKFSKATTTIATAILDLTRCRQRLSAPNFQCLCVSCSRSLALCVCARV